MHRTTSIESGVTAIQAVLNGNPLQCATLSNALGAEVVAVSISLSLGRVPVAVTGSAVTPSTLQLLHQRASLAHNVCVSGPACVPLRWSQRNVYQDVLWLGARHGGVVVGVPISAEQGLGALLVVFADEKQSFRAFEGLQALGRLLAPHIATHEQRVLSTFLAKKRWSQQGPVTTSGAASTSDQQHDWQTNAKRGSSCCKAGQHNDAQQQEGRQECGPACTSCIWHDFSRFSWRQLIATQVLTVVAVLLTCSQPQLPLSLHMDALSGMEGAGRRQDARLLLLLLACLLFNAVAPTECTSRRAVRWSLRLVLLLGLPAWMVSSQQLLPWHMLGHVASALQAVRILLGPVVRALAARAVGIKPPAYATVLLLSVCTSLLRDVVPLWVHKGNALWYLSCGIWVTLAASTSCFALMDALHDNTVTWRKLAHSAPGEGADAGAVAANTGKGQHGRAVLDQCMGHGSQQAAERSCQGTAKRTVLRESPGRDLTSPGADTEVGAKSGAGDLLQRECQADRLRSNEGDIQAGAQPKMVRGVAVEGAVACAGLQRPVVKSLLQTTQPTDVHVVHGWTFAGDS